MPENVQTGLVARHQFGIRIALEALGLAALVAVFRVVAGDEILQVIGFQRAGFELEMLVGAQGVEPHALGMHLAVFLLGPIQS